MSGLEMGSGVVGIIVIFVIALWAMLWLLVPFMLWAITNRLYLIHETLKKQAEPAPSAAPPEAPVKAPTTDELRAETEWLVKGVRNGKKRSIKVRASDQYAASEKAMVAGMEVDGVTRA